MKQINERFWLRARVVHHDPMANPEDGWVQGFFYKDLCLDKNSNPVMKSFIRSGEMNWEVDPKTLGMFTGFYDCSTEPQPIFEGDILHTTFKDNSSCYDLVGWNPKCGCFGIMDEVDYNARMEGEEDDFSCYAFEWMNHNDAKYVVVGNIHENAELMKQTP